MSKTTARFGPVIVVLFLASTACLITGESPAGPESNPEDAVATSVAATLAASQAQEPTPEPDPTEDPGSSESGPGPSFSDLGVSFTYDPTLADSATAVIVPGEVDEGNVWFSYPEHREIQLSGWVLSDTFHDAVIRIYPVEEFRAVNENVDQGLNTLEDALESGDTGEVRVLNFFNAAQFIQSQVAFLEFQNGRGVRYLSQYGQAAWPIGWPEMFYTFQGLTDDGRYYISLILPATHLALPVPDDVVMDDAFYDNFMTYAAEKEAELNGYDPESFTPALSFMDQIVESLAVLDP